MKKKTLIFLFSTLLIVAMAIQISAAIKPQNAVGAIVYVGYTDKAPNMKGGVIDESWGNAIHIDKNSEQAGMWACPKNNKGEYWSPDDTECDLYFLFDDSKFYFAVVTPDKNQIGGINGGDAVCFNFEANNPNLVYHCNLDERFYPDGFEGHKEYRTFGAYIEFDDESIFWPEGYVEDFSWTYTRTGYVIKWAITWKELGVGAKELNDGCLWNFTFTRSQASDPLANGGDGWLYWGKWFDISLKKGAKSDSYYVADSPNAKSPNTWIFSKKNTETYVTFEYEEPGKGSTVPETPATPVEKPSGWAEKEVNEAVAAGLVPAELQKNYTKGISRADLSKMLSALLDKVYGKAPQTTDAKFTDTTDIAVLKAANLGIINGYKQNDGSYAFKPNNTLKRSEMSAIINRVAKLCGKTTTGYDKEVKFTDTVNHWCKSELGYPVHMGIVKGTSATAFSPENTLTVEQTIMMTYRTYTALK